MISLTIAITLISLSKKGVVFVDGQEPDFSPIVPVIWAVLASICFALSQTITRKFCQPPWGLSSIQITADGSVPLCLVLLCLGIHYHFFVQPYTFKEVAIVGVASTILQVGVCLINYSTVHGKGGPT